jgi:small subunit ribosomal protein S1
VALHSLFYYAIIVLQIALNPFVEAIKNGGKFKMETMDDYKDELEASLRRINEGDIISGTVIDVNEEEVTLDLKYYAQGIIKVADLSNDPDFAVLEEVHNGDVIEATVVKTDDGAGNILLSRKEANEVLAWDKLQQLLEEETIVKVKIKESVPSGVVTYLEGVRAFIPASQLSLDYVEDTDSWVGKEIEARVITVDASKEKLVLSGKAVAKEREAEERNHRISMIIPGSVLEGTVESLMPYGAFINLGNGLSGLVHISQICERRIGKPSEVLKVGQKVKAKVLNTNDNKISLSMKALEEEMVDTEGAAELENYSNSEPTGTSLGALLAGFKFD